MLKRQSKNGGFTLIELMVVIAIIAILALIAIPWLMQARFRTYHSACIQNMRNIGTAMEMYAIEHKGLFPDDLDELADPNKPFLPEMPTCPTTDFPYGTGYTISSDRDTYLVVCKGMHHLQFPGVVEEDYPQLENGQVSTHGPL